MEEGNVSGNRSITDAHKTLLQVFMSKQVMKDEEFNATLEQLKTIYNLQGNLNADDFINMINNQLHFVNFDIRKTVSENDGSIYYGLVNTRSDKESQLGTSFGLPEVNLFKKIVEAIAHHDESEREPPTRIRMVDALNLTDSIPSLSKNKAEDVIDSMAKAKWLHIEKEGNSVFIYLGVRTFLELRSWLEEIYSLAECVMCSEPVIRGISCQNKKCPVRAHIHCSNRWFKDRRDKKCPTCQTEWNVQ